MTTPRVTVPVDDLERVRDLLMERIHGSPARSPAHNARLEVEAMLSAAPAPEGVAVEDLREALIQADLKIRSLPGTDQSDVEFIRAALATREEAPDWTARTEAAWAENNSEEAPAEAGELVGLIDYLENMRAETVTDEGREIMSEWINAIRAQPPAREDDWTPFELKPNDIANIIDRHADCGDDGLHNASQLAELIYQAGKKYDTHPAPDALRVAVEAFGVITDLSVNLRQGGPDSSDLNDLSDALNTAVDVAHEALAALQAEQGAK